MSGRRAPDFWWRPASLSARLLLPAAALVGALARRNLENGRRAAFDLPVLCVGNFTAGGGGKTPTALALAAAAREAGRRPGFVSRGYGRSARQALIVDPARHTVADVGDEPLLLVAAAPTAVAADRAAALRLLERERAVDFVIMDDGFQSQRLLIDYAVIALDARRGLGNGHVVPAGPLRAPLLDQVRRADALVVIGTGEGSEGPVRAMARAGRAVFAARLAPKSRHILIGEKVLAFAGIADPAKFYASLEELGAEIATTRDFPDHHGFSDAELDDLVRTAAEAGLILATTRKDAVRLATGSPAARAFHRDCAVIDVALEFAGRHDAARIVKETLAAYERRRWATR
ncbi:tetraacyldisaccharide 4'-kinase [Jiella sonneratiae]|uniref:Tetraacyldisaccharide 4'-kinase n=1 Tax=Jiella sonneratiae TaxID=2816856 RepID=A0ABS3J462_9HYPH|nr:tetraacyldisaccharide 4'-kinase [Jiella sonneratiae]MBO0904464.1 tetraacyldisaccharide 4'-kinase [Jiella sonneratiae]